MITVSHASTDGLRIEFTIDDEPTLEALRESLRDPVWLLGATWDVLTTNDYKRGRFDDAIGAWMGQNEAADIRATLDAAGIDA